MGLEPLPHPLVMAREKKRYTPRDPDGFKNAVGIEKPTVAQCNDRGILATEGPQFAVIQEMRHTAKLSVATQGQRQPL